MKYMSLLSDGHLSTHTMLKWRTKHCMANFPCESSFIERNFIFRHYKKQKFQDFTSIPFENVFSTLKIVIHWKYTNSGRDFLAKHVQIWMDPILIIFSQYYIYIYSHCIPSENWRKIMTCSNIIIIKLILMQQYV